MRVWLISILGLLLFVYSCGEDGPEHRIYGINKITFMRQVSHREVIPLDKDTIDAESLIVRVVFYDMLLVHAKGGFKLVNSAYATPHTLPRYTLWEVDSLRIFKTDSLGDIDITPQFGFLENFNEVAIDNKNDTCLERLNELIFKVPVYLDFRWMKPPSITQKHQFKFQFFSKDQMLEKNTDFVIIKGK